MQKKLVKNGHIQYKTVIDPAKLGLINIIVLYNYRTIDNDKIFSLLQEVGKHPDIIMVDNVGQGADLILEYCVPNLSYFNKQHRRLLHKYRDFLQVSNVDVVIVKHLYERKYLIDEPSTDSSIICGDRDIIPLKDTQQVVLNAFNRDAKERIVNIADVVGLDPKTIVLLKRYLEFKKIIRKYTISLDNQALGIKRWYLYVQPQFENLKDMDRLMYFTKHHPNIVEATKVIGEYELLLTIEYTDTANVLADIRQHFQIARYRMLESNKLSKLKYTP